MNAVTLEEQDRAGVKAWFDTWGTQVAACDFTAARALFDDHVVGFGTWADMLEGLDALEARQWRNIWPTIRDFRHHTEDLVARISPDRLMAVGLVVWTSTGFGQDGEAYERPGRTTAVLTRPTTTQPWRCVHTHVSLYRGVPQRSFGPPA